MGGYRELVDGLLFASTTSLYKEKQAAAIMPTAADFRVLITADFASSLEPGTAGLKSAIDAVKAGPALTVPPKETEAAVAYAKAHLREGYRRPAWIIVGEHVVYLAAPPSYRILDRYDLLYRWKRPQPGQDRHVPRTKYGTLT